jgi:hypothetical protein
VFLNPANGKNTGTVAVFMRLAEEADEARAEVLGRKVKAGCTSGQTLVFSAAARRIGKGRALQQP